MEFENIIKYWKRWTYLKNLCIISYDKIKRWVKVMHEITDKEFELLSTYTKKNFGIFLTSEKKSMINSRLKNVLKNLGFSSFTQYYEYLVKDKTGVANAMFIDKITTNHTFFMREVDHFQFLRETVFPELSQKVSDKDIRMWCAGCSSGEESYTLQMLLTDYFSDKGGWNTELLATDISTDILKKAFRGQYAKDKIKTLDKNWQSNYFKSVSSTEVQVIDGIKDKITYRKFNLMEPKFSFRKKFQVIFCRNVMIYFDDATREWLVNRFYDASEKGAYLFIGHSETLNNLNTQYEYVCPAVYQKK